MRIYATILPWVILINALITKIGALPNGFAVEVGLSGVELVWSTNTTAPVRMGSARPEFRLASGVVFGYPREIKGKLVLPLSIKEQAVLASKDGQNMEVWSSGRRIDSFAPANNFATIGDSGGTSAKVVAFEKAPTVEVNPAARGSLNSTRLSYNLTMLQLKNSPEFPFPLEVVGEVTLPTTLQASVKYPLILFLHGRHGTCYQGGSNGFESGEWPCPVGWLPKIGRASCRERV